MTDHHDHENCNDPTHKHNAGPNFSLQNIYIKDLSFEAPNNPDIFRHEWDPKVEFDMHVETGQHDPVHHEVILHVTVTVRINVKDAKGVPSTMIAFLSEVKQAGIFALEGFAKDDLEHILHVVAPEVIFPYVRETVSSLVLKGGFPQLLLPPMNFQALYEQSKQQKVAASDKEAANSSNMDA